MPFLPTRDLAHPSFVSSRAAHPSREGDQQHLHRSGSARQHGGHVRRVSTLLSGLEKDQELIPTSSAATTDLRACAGSRPRFTASPRSSTTSSPPFPRLLTPSRTRTSSTPSPFRHLPAPPPCTLPRRRLRSTFARSTTTPSASRSTSPSASWTSSSSPTSSSRPRVSQPSRPRT